MRARTGSRGGLALSATLIALGVFALTIVAAIGAAAASAVTPVEAANGGSAEQRAERAALKRFRSCDRLRNYLQAHRGVVRTIGLPMAAEDALGGATGPVAAAPTESAPPSNPTQTNVQEAGVDEPDVVKLAGETILALSGRTLHAVDAGGEAPLELGSVRIPDGPGELSYAESPQLLVHGERAVVISSSWGTGETLVAEIDFSDPAAMVVTRTMRLEGSFVSARLTGATARLVLTAYPGVPIAERGHGRAWMPSAVVHDRAAGERRRGKLLPCSQVSRSRAFSGAELTTVLTLDLSQGIEPIDSDALMTSGEIVYASPESLYVATTRWLGEPAAAEQLSDVDTQIHRFATSEPATTEYVASGRVDGFMLSQWSMSEQDGLLRVASTSSPPWGPDGPRAKSESFVTVLAPDGTKLRQVGRLDGLGVDEQIYAVRFIGDLGYVVTFRQVDPLHVIDLSDPTAPVAVGELEIPGYSAYLHPVGEGLLLGVGQDADPETGSTQGVQVSLFDVSDPAAPVRLDQESFGGQTYSPVEYDHHAFSFFAEHGLAMVPIELYGFGREFHGAAGLRIDPAGGGEAIGRVAKLSHGSSYRAQIVRSLAVGDRIFTLSAKGLAMHNPATLEQTGFVAF